jgi:hypothetical protein
VYEKSARIYDLLSAIESAGLRARVVPFMPARDRIVGTRN